MKRICCFALALGLPLGAINAQETPTLAPGARVRVTNEEHLHVVRVVGTLESIDSSTIIVRRDDGDTMNVPRQPGAQLEVSGGPGSCIPDRSRCVILVPLAVVSSLVRRTGAGDGRYSSTQVAPVTFRNATSSSAAMASPITTCVMSLKYWSRSPTSCPSEKACVFPCPSVAEY